MRNPAGGTSLERVVEQFQTAWLAKAEGEAARLPWSGLVQQTELWQHDDDMQSSAVTHVEARLGPCPAEKVARAYVLVVRKLATKNIDPQALARRVFTAGVTFHEFVEDERVAAAGSENSMDKT